MSKPILRSKTYNKAHWSWRCSRGLAFHMISEWLKNKTKVYLLTRYDYINYLMTQCLGASRPKIKSGYQNHKLHRKQGSPLQPIKLMTISRSTSRATSRWTNNLESVKVYCSSNPLIFNTRKDWFGLMGNSNE